MKEKFIATNNPKIPELIREVQMRINRIVISELASKSAVVPDIKTVIMNEYAITMQVCSHILMETVTKIAQVKDASEAIVDQTDMDKFAKMTNQERKDWVIKKFHENQKPKQDPNVRLKDKFRDAWEKKNR